MELILNLLVIASKRVIFESTKLTCLTCFIILEPFVLTDSYCSIICFTSTQPELHLEGLAESTSSKNRKKGIRWQPMLRVDLSTDLTLKLLVITSKRGIFESTKVTCLMWFFILEPLVLTDSYCSIIALKSTTRIAS